MLKFYILTDNPMYLSKVKDAIDQGPINIQLQQISLSNFRQFTFHQTDIILLDHIYLMTDLLKLDELKDLSWVLVSNEVMLHYRIFSNPPIKYINIRLPNSIIRTTLEETILSVSNIHQSPKLNHKMELLDIKRKRIFQNISDIVYIESFGDYSKVYVMNSDTSGHYSVSHNLKHLEEKLAGHSFFRVHRSYIVNLDYLYKEQSFVKNFLILKGGIKIPIARRRKRALLDNIQNLIHTNTYSTVKQNG